MGSFLNRKLCLWRYKNILAFQSKYKRNNPLPSLSVSVPNNRGLEEVQPDPMKTENLPILFSRHFKGVRRSLELAAH